LGREQKFNQNFLCLFQAKVDRNLTIVIFGVVSIMAGSFSMFLPETNQRKLPDSIEEGEAFGKGETSDGFKKGFKNLSIDE
jgi:hypothetical protein